jgi:aminomethyltransferase
MFYLYQDNSMRTQHQAVRSTAGWYDFTHRVLEVTGADARAFLNKMYPANLDTLAVGRAKYTVMLDEDGLICDDVIIFCLEEQKFWISTLYMKDLIKRFGWYAEDFDVTYEDITAAWRMYSVQGPASAEIVDAVIDDSVEGMKFFSIKDTSMGKVPLKVARSGYTGEKLGFELYVPVEQASALEAKLDVAAKKSKALHVTEIDVMALTLSAEAGYYLMLDIRRCTPFEVGFGDTIYWDKNFVGKKALKKLKDKTPARQLVGIEVPDYDAVIYGGPKGATVMKDGKAIGRVTRFTYGYTVEKNIGYALIDYGSVSAGDSVQCSGYEALITEKSRLS